MKRVTSIKNVMLKRITLALLATLMLAGCGQKGPLQLPDTTVSQTSQPE